MKKESMKKEADEISFEFQKSVQRKKQFPEFWRIEKTKQIGQVINLPKIFSYIVFLMY